MSSCPKRIPTFFIPDSSQFPQTGGTVPQGLRRGWRVSAGLLEDYWTPLVALFAANLRRFEKGEPLPDYFKNHPVYYAGPAKTPDGYASGQLPAAGAQLVDEIIDLAGQDGRARARRALRGASLRGGSDLRRPADRLFPQPASVRRRSSLRAAAPGERRREGAVDAVWRFDHVWLLLVAGSRSTWPTSTGLRPCTPS